MNTELNADACRKRAAPSVPGDDDTVSLLRSVEGALERRFGDALAPDERRELACKALEEFTDSAVTNYLPILVERCAVHRAAERIRSQPTTQPSTH